MCLPTVYMYSPLVNSVYSCVDLSFALIYGRSDRQCRLSGARIACHVLFALFYAYIGIYD